MGSVRDDIPTHLRNHTQPTLLPIIFQNKIIFVIYSYLRYEWMIIKKKKSFKTKKAVPSTRQEVRLWKDVYVTGLKVLGHDSNHFLSHSRILVYQERLHQSLSGLRLRCSLQALFYSD